MRVGVNDLAKANIRTEIKSFHEILRILHTTAKRLRKNSNVVRIFCCGKASYEKKKKNTVQPFFPRFNQLIGKYSLNGQNTRIVVRCVL